MPCPVVLCPYRCSSEGRVHDVETITITTTITITITTTIAITITITMFTLGRGCVRHPCTESLNNKFQEQGV